MTHLAIVAWTAEGRVAKYQDYATESEAAAHVARLAQRWPDAFVAPHPGGGFADWKVVDGALALDPVPAAEPPYRDLRAEEYRKRLGKLPGNTQMETIGDVLDALIKAVVGGDATELQAIAAEVQQIKAEVPKPAGTPTP